MPWRWIFSDLLEAKATQRLVLLLIICYAPVYLLNFPGIAEAVLRVIPAPPHISASSSGGENLINTIYLHGGLSSSGIASGQVWQIVTHGLLHANLLHLVFNVIILVMAGFQAERIIGRRGLMKLFFGGVICGGLGHLLLQPSVLANTTLVGASGGIAALFFWMITVSPDARSRFLPCTWETLGKILMAAQVVAVASLWITHGQTALPTDGAVRIVGHACHLGGSLFGWWMARRQLSPNISEGQALELRTRREARLQKEAGGGH